MWIKSDYDIAYYMKREQGGEKLWSEQSPKVVMYV